MLFFTVRFPKLLTNNFRSSFEIPEVRYEHGNSIMYLPNESNCELGNEVVNFTQNFIGKLTSWTLRARSLCHPVKLSQNFFRHFGYNVHRLGITRFYKMGYRPYAKMAAAFILFLCLYLN